MSDKNSSDSPYFTGSIPEHYDAYLGPYYFEPYAIDISERIDPNGLETVLEIGSGTGRVTRHLRRVLPSSCTLIASDISPDMLAVAKEKLSSENIDWRIIDAQDLPLEDNSIDLVVSCFAFMFVEDKAKAFQEVKRVLKKGGTFLLALWDKLERNGASNDFRTIVKRYLGDDIPPTCRMPFGFYDHDEIEGYLKEAGFTNIIIEDVAKTAHFASAQQAAYGLSHGGSLYNEIVKRNPAWVEEISLELEKVLRAKYGEPVSAPMSAVICRCTKPST
jgi:ubiquinone/menaquinone biosynthesis C-methylase UbiE